jgi:outer membrane murein-binding lipoprotein Lpp
VTIERWTDQKLDKLADIVDRLVSQADRLSSQIDQLGSRLERTADSIDALIGVVQPQMGSVPEAVANPTDPQTDPSIDWVARVSALEAQVQQLAQRVQGLERNQFISHVPHSGITLEEEEIEDEPDEILWDFMEPDSPGSSK